MVVKMAPISFRSYSLLVALYPTTATEMSQSSLKLSHDTATYLYFIHF